MTSIITPADATLAALIGIAVTAVFAALVALRARNAAYLLPILWGLAGAYVEESQRNDPVANGLVVAFAVLALLVIVIVIRQFGARTNRVAALQGLASAQNTLCALRSTVASPATSRE
jgi:hypothetical protein